MAVFGEGVTQTYDSGYYVITAEQKKLLELTGGIGTTYVLNGTTYTGDSVELSPGDTLEVYVPNEGFAEVTFFDVVPVDNWIQRETSGFFVSRWLSPNRTLQKHDGNGDLVVSIPITTGIDKILTDQNGDIIYLGWYGEITKRSGQDLSVIWTVIDSYNMFGGTHYGAYMAITIDNNGDIYTTAAPEILRKRSGSTGSIIWETKIYPAHEDDVWQHYNPVAVDNDGGVWASTRTPYHNEHGYQPDWLRRFSASSGSLTWVSSGEDWEGLGIWQLLADKDGNITPMWNNNWFRKYAPDGTLLYNVEYSYPCRERYVDEIQFANTSPAILHEGYQKVDKYDGAGASFSPETIYSTDPDSVRYWALTGEDHVLIGIENQVLKFSPDGTLTDTFEIGTGYPGRIASLDATAGIQPAKVDFRGIIKYDSDGFLFNSVGASVGTLLAHDATAGTATLELSDEQAASIVDADIFLWRKEVIVDFDAEGLESYSSWGDVLTGDDLAIVLNAQTPRLSVSYDIETITLSFATTDGTALRYSLPGFYITGDEAHSVRAKGGVTFKGLATVEGDPVVKAKGKTVFRGSPSARVTTGDIVSAKGKTVFRGAATLAVMDAIMPPAGKTVFRGHASAEVDGNPLIKAKGKTVFRGSDKLSVMLSNWSTASGNFIWADPGKVKFLSGVITISVNESAIPDATVINWDTSAIRYRCTLTGAADGVADIVLPISSFQSRLRKNPRPSYLSVIVPDATLYLPYVIARPNGEIVIEQGRMYPDGIEYDDLVRADYETFGFVEGARNSSIDLTGHRTLPVTSPQIVDLRGVSIQAQQQTGIRRTTSAVDFRARPGDTVRWASQQMIAGMIAIAVGQRTATMTITEAET